METSCLPLLNAGFEPRVSDNKSPANWVPADKLTELLRIKLKTSTQQPVPVISEHWAHSTPLPVGFRTGLLLIGLLGINFSDFFFIKIKKKSYREISLKMLFAKCILSQPQFVDFLKCSVNTYKCDFHLCCNHTRPMSWDITDHVKQKHWHPIT